MLAVFVVVVIAIAVAIADCNLELLGYSRCLELQTCHLQSED